jgi:hypothetical protein
MIRWAVAVLSASLLAGDFPRQLEAFRGKTPALDGVISKDE